MVDPGFISYCERQTRDGTPKIRRLAEVSVCILKLSKQLPIVDGVPVESVIMELYPGYQDQKAGLRNPKSQGPSRAFLTSTTVDKINLTRLKERQSKLLEITVSMGLILLQERKYAAALVAAKQYLVLVADIFGTNSLELIPAYLLIAETSIGLNKLREAEQQLQKANWVVMRNENDETIDYVKQGLYRVLGLLHAAKGNKDEAIRLFSEQIFYSSQLKGTESIQAASGYFNLANTIDGKQVKHSLYLKVLECWLEIVNSNDLETITQAEIYESAKILQDLAKQISSFSAEESDDHLLCLAVLNKYMKDMNLPGHEIYKEQATNIIQQHNIDNNQVNVLLSC